MIKKLTAITLTAVMTIGAAAISAQGASRLILNGYDENGRLVLSDMFVSEDGNFDISPKRREELSKYRLRSYIIGSGEISDFVLETPKPSEEPEETPVPTAKPQATAKPQKTYPSIYEKQIDAVNAVAVVSKVSQGVDGNSEKRYYADVMYQGSEMQFGISADVTISQASDEFGYMVGQDALALQRGDVICLSADLSGEIDNIGFVYRPIEENIVTDGNDYGNSFEKLVSKNGAIANRKGWSVMTCGASNRDKNQLAFGVISDKRNKSLTLLGADGDENNALDLTLSDDTIVYMCDMSAKRALSVKSIAAITASALPKADENGFVEYGSGRTNYALLRVVDGTVTDAVIYSNYNR